MNMFTVDELFGGLFGKATAIRKIYLRLFDRTEAYHNDVKPLVMALDELLDVEAAVERRRKHLGSGCSREEIMEMIYESAQRARERGVEGLRRNLSIRVPLLRVGHIKGKSPDLSISKADKKRLKHSLRILSETSTIGIDACWTEFIEEFGEKDTLDLCSTDSEHIFIHGY